MATGAVGGACMQERVAAVAMGRTSAWSAAASVTHPDAVELAQRGVDAGIGGVEHI